MIEEAEKRAKAKLARIIERRVLGTKLNMAEKDKTPCRRQGAGSQGPSSASQTHQPLSSRTSK